MPGMNPSAWEMHCHAVLAPSALQGIPIPVPILIPAGALCLLHRGTGQRFRSTEVAQEASFPFP